MAVLQMRKISICALKKERKPILEQIQRSGILEINIAKGEEDGFQFTDTSAAKSSFERNAANAESALEIINQYAPKGKSIFSSLEGKRQITLKEFRNVMKNRDIVMESVRNILQLQKDILANKAEIIKLQGQMESINPWLKMDVPGMTRGTERTTYLYGSFPESMTQEQVYQKIEKNGNFPEASDVRVIYYDRNQTCVGAFCMKQDETAFEDALREMGFARPAIIMRSRPEITKQHWTERIEKCEAEKEAAENKIIELAENSVNIQTAADYFRSRAQKYEILGQILQTKNVFFITGYIPANKEKWLKETLTSKYTVMIETEEIPVNEENPVLLENNSFAKPVESIVESFGLPKKGEVDPSFIMSLFYYFLFGMMLSDAAYGLVIFISCFIALKKFPRMSKSLNQSLHMFMYCGISTIIWGVLFGGYFGDAINIVAQTFFHKTVTVPALWFEPINNPMRLLLYSMIIGVIHMYTGLAIKGYMLLRDKKILDFVYDVLLWYAFLTGLVLLLIPTELFISISQVAVELPTWLSLLSKILAIGGAIGILFMSGRRKKNKWPIRIALGAYDIYNVSGWLSDVLSYSRLLALGLATGVIASVINLMGNMLGNGVVAAIGFIVIFILGHTLNLAINLLGAYVHTNRLQYVEFFGKFYNGGGRAFNPFRLKTNHIEIKED